MLEPIKHAQAVHDLHRLGAFASSPWSRFYIYGRKGTRPSNQMPPIRDLLPDFLHLSLCSLLPFLRIAVTCSYIFVSIVASGNASQTGPRFFKYLKKTTKP